jgi:hypothetical protein
MTINYSKQVLLKRGNTAVSSTYIGPLGEVTVDTDFATIRVHDGVTPGGHLSTSSASGATPPSNPRESSIWYDTVGGRLYVYYDGAWVDASPAGDLFLAANVANLSAQVTGLTSDVANVETHIASLDANIGAFETAVNVTVGTINSNINSLNQTIAAFEANAGPTSDAWVDDAPPDISNVGALWYDDVSGRLYVYYDGAWIDANPPVTTGFGNVLPSANVTYSLGSEQYQWKDLWVSNNTIYIGNTPITVSNGALLVGGNAVSGGTGTYGNANVADYLSNYPGGLTFTSSVANISGVDIIRSNEYQFANGANILSNLTGNIVLSGNVIGLDQDARGAENTYMNISPNPEGWAYLQLPNDFSANVTDTRLWNAAGNVEIGSGDFSTGSTSYAWIFGQDGSLTVPKFGTINFVDPVIGGFGTPNTTTRTPGNRIVLYPSFNGSGLVDYAIGIDGDVQWYSIPDSNARFEWYAGNNKVLSLSGDGNLTFPDSTIQSTAWTGITGFGEGFSLTAADKIVTNKLYSTNETQPNQHYRLELDTNGVVVLPDGSIINGSTIRGIAGTGELNYTGITIGPDSGDAEKTWMWVDHENAYIGTNNLANTWTFGENGSLTFPSDLIIQSDPFNPGTVISQANALMTVITTGNAATYIGWGEFGNGEPGNIALVAFNDDAGAVAIQTGATTGPEAFNEWIFDADGNLTLPGKLWARASDDGSISFTNDGTTERGYLKVDAGYNMVVNAENNFYVKRNGTDRLAITDTTSDFKATTDLRFVSNLAGSNNTWTFNSTGILTLPLSSYIETTDANLKVGSQGTVTIRSNAATLEGLKTWTFGTDGSLTFPTGGNLIFDSSATSVIDGVTSITANGNVTAAQYNFANGVNIFDTITGVTSINTSVSTLTVSDASGDYTYGALNYSYAVNGASNSFDIQYSAPLAFGNVDISVGNVITAGTANVANLIISGTAPGTLTGSAGDTAGMIRVDSNYIYYCTSTFASSSYTVGWDGSVGNTLFLTQGAYPTPQVGWTVTQSIYTFTIDTVTDDGYGHWQITYTGVPYGSPNGGTATLTNPNPATIWSQTPLAATTYANTNVAAYLAGNVTTGNIIATQYNFANGANILANVATKVTGSWTVTNGTNTYSFTVPSSGTYLLWVIGNIPDGIIAWNATATVTNSNVPVVGAQYAWVYTGGGTPIDFVSIPNQFTGTANTIVRSSVAPSATTNRFDFGINNASGSSQVVIYGYTKL